MHFPEATLLIIQPNALAVVKRGTPRGKVLTWNTRHQSGFNDSAVGYDKYPPVGRYGFQRIHPRLLLTLPHSGRWTALMNELSKDQKGSVPCPPFMMTDLGHYFRWDVAEGFELFIDSETHCDGCLQRAWTMAGEYEVKGSSDSLANLTSQSDPLCGKV
jgi:hypothetical protein